MKRADCPHANVIEIKRGPDIRKGRCQDCNAIVYGAVPK